MLEKQGVWYTLSYERQCVRNVFKKCMLPGGFCKEKSQGKAKKSILHNENGGVRDEYSKNIRTVKIRGSIYPHV